MAIAGLHAIRHDSLNDLGYQRHLVIRHSGVVVITDEYAFAAHGVIRRKCRPFVRVFDVLVHVLEGRFFLPFRQCREVDKRQSTDFVGAVLPDAVELMQPGKA